MTAPIAVRLIGAPVPCAGGVKDTWREVAAWAGRPSQPRQDQSRVIGNIHARSDGARQLDPECAVRWQKIQSFGFAPGPFCGGCERSASNVKAGCANDFRACGGCLWPQGVIRCP